MEASARIVAESSVARVGSTMILRRSDPSTTRGDERVDSPRLRWWVSATQSVSRVRGGVGVCAGSRAGAASSACASSVVLGGSPDRASREVVTPVSGRCHLRSGFGAGGLEEPAVPPRRLGGGGRMSIIDMAVRGA